MSRERVLIAEVTSEDSLGVDATIYLADKAMRPFRGSDPDRPNQDYDPVLIDAARADRRIFADMHSGVGDIGVSVMTIADADAAYTYLKDHSVKSIAVYAGFMGTEVDPYLPDAFSTFKPIFIGNGDGSPDLALSTTQPSRITILGTDLRGQLDDLVQGVTYAGTNVGSAGYEGTANDIKNQTKPIALGDLSIANIPLVRVNSSRIVYQGHDAVGAGGLGAGSILRLYDRGGAAGLTLKAEDSNATFDTETILSTQYATNPNRGLILAPNLGGQLTADMQGSLLDGTFHDDAPNIIKWLLKRRGFAPAQIGTTFGTLAGTLTRKVGYWTGLSAPSYKTLIDLLARSVGCAVLPDNGGVWQMYQFLPPTGSAVFDFGDDDVIALSPDSQAIVPPAGRVTIQFAQNFQVMQGRGPISDDVMDNHPDRVDFLGLQFRTSDRTDATVKARWPNARQIALTTALTQGADADTLRELLFTLHGAPRLQLVLDTEMTSDTLDLALADEVSLTYTPQSISQNFRIAGIAPTVPRNNLIRYYLWG